MIYFLSTKRPINLGNNSTKAHIVSPKRDIYAKNSILARLYFTSLANYIVYKKLKEYMFPLNSYYNDAYKSVKRKMLSTRVRLRRCYVRQRLMSEKKLLSTIFLQVIHKGKGCVSYVAQKTYDKITKVIHNLKT